MLEPISLDNQGFEEIFRKARSQISEIYPAWTDYNYHDPGITILEMLAFLKEAQQFHMNYNNPQVLKNFLALLGGVEKDTVPAILELDFKDGLTLKKGSKFWTQDICMESSELLTVVPDTITGITTQNGFFRKNQLPKILPFGEIPKVGDSCYIHLSTPLEVEKDYQLSLKFKNKYPRKEITSLENFMILGDFNLEYLTEKGYETLHTNDTTARFLQDGTLSFTVSEEMKIGSVHQNDGYFLKFTLTKDDYDFPPVISDISLSCAQVVQRDTKAVMIETKYLSDYETDNKKIDYYIEENDFYKLSQDSGDIAVLYEKDYYESKEIAVGTGFANQKYQIIRNELIEEISLKILVEDVTKSNFYQQYTRVQNFASSNQNSFHFVLDSHGVIYFGDGEHGVCPETKIILVGLAFTKGKKGEITSKNSVNNANKLTVANVNNIIKEANEHETVEALTDRLQQRNGRLVTADDYEKAIVKTQGLCIEDCKVLQDDDDSTVRIVVRTKDYRTTLSKLYKENILRQMESKRLIGTTITLQSPVYIHAEVYVEVYVNKQYLYAKDTIESTIKNYFNMLEVFNPVIEHNSLYKQINSLPAVVDINSLTIDTNGDGVIQSRNGDVITPPAGVVILDRIHCIIIN